MNSQMTITVEFSRDGLLSLRRQIDEFLGPERTDSAELHRSSTASPSDLAAAIDTRFGKSSKRFLEACADLAAERDTFTLTEVAERMDEDINDVRAYSRNLGRSEKQLSGSAPLLQRRREAGVTRYSMNPELRSAILAVRNGYLDGQR